MRYRRVQVLHQPTRIDPEDVIAQSPQFAIPPRIGAAPLAVISAIHLND